MPIRVLHLSTHNEACGIGRYQEMFLSAMAADARIENEFFEDSPSRFHGMPEAERVAVFARLWERLEPFDILHIQHEFSFFVDDTLSRACDVAKTLGKKIVVTVHTGVATIFTRVPFEAKTPRDVARWVKRSLLMRKAIGTVLRNLVEPLKTVDLILVHNEKAKADLVAQGVPAEKFAKIVIPVPLADQTLTSDEIGRHLRKGPEDVVVGIVGFINRLKGTDDAVEAVALLPENYKLAIVGGLHPRGSAPNGHPAFLEELEALIYARGVRDRVHITGYIGDDSRLDALVRECDVCIFPYDRVQYGNSSSAALNNALANGRPVAVYPTDPFKEINTLGESYLEIAKDFSPAEIAHSIRNIDVPAARQLSKKFSERYSYPMIARELVELYSKL